MTQLVGKLVNSGGVAITGELIVTLDAPLVDTSTTPDQLYLAASRSFPITAGMLTGIDIVESQSKNITYHFAVNRYETLTTYWLADGTQYAGPFILHTDSNYYTGTFYDAATSQRLGKVDTQNAVNVLDFHAIVPNVAQVEFASLIPTRISTDSLPTTIRAIAELLTSDPDFIAALRGGPRFQGVYSASTYYQRDDSVTYGGSSWVWINSAPAANQTPSTTNTAYWQILAQKGDAGGTGGNDTAYNATGWDGATDAPSRNAVRDLVEGQLVKAATLANYAPLASPALTGTPIAPTATTGTRTTQLATTAFVGNEFAPLASPTFTGTPTAPTASTSSNSLAIANTAWINSIKGIANGLASLDSLSRVPAGQLGFTQNNAASGWTKLPNGLLLQWTEYTVSSQSFAGSTLYSFSISFPTSFSQVYQVFGSQAAGNTGSAFINVSFENLTNTGVTAVIAYGLTTTASPRFRVFAIGI